MKILRDRMIEEMKLRTVHCLEPDGGPVRTKEVRQPIRLKIGARKLNWTLSRNWRKNVPSRTNKIGGYGPFKQGEKLRIFFPILLTFAKLIPGRVRFNC